MGPRSSQTVSPLAPQQQMKSLLAASSAYKVERQSIDNLENSKNYYRRRRRRSEKRKAKPFAITEIKYRLISRL